MGSLAVKRPKKTGTKETLLLFFLCSVFPVGAAPPPRLSSLRQEVCLAFLPWVLGPCSWQSVAWTCLQSAPFRLLSYLLSLCTVFMNPQVSHSIPLSGSGEGPAVLSGGWATGGSSYFRV